MTLIAASILILTFVLIGIAAAVGMFDLLAAQAIADYRGNE